MADFTSTDGSPTSSLLSGTDPVTAVDGTPTTSEVTTDGITTNLVDPSAYVTTPIWYGGAQITYVMRGRIPATTNYVYWNSINFIDVTGIYAPQAGLLDIAISARIAR